MAIPEVISGARYLNLATFRKSGEAVPTPIWAAEADGHLYAFTESRSGKVKRLRNSSRVQVATCTVSGKLTGQWWDGQAFIVQSNEEVERAYRALRAKYGWQMTLTDLASRVAGRYDKRAILRIEM